MSKRDDLRSTAQQLLIKASLDNGQAFNAWKITQDEPLDFERFTFPGNDILTLDGCDFGRANCQESYFANIIRRDPESSYGLTSCRKMDFSNADLRGAYCKGVDFSGSKFWGAKLDGADLTECNFDQCGIKAEQLTSCKLSGARLTRINFDFASVFDDMDLQNVDFSRSSFAHGVFENTDLRGAKFFGCCLNLDHVDFKGARFSGNIEDVGFPLYRMEELGLLDEAIMPISWWRLLIEYRKLLQSQELKSSIKM